MRYLHFVILIACLSGNAYAAKWDIVPGLSIAGIFADNVDLEPDDVKQSDFITELLPSILLNTKSNRFNTDLYYALQALNFSKNSDKSRVFHQLNANAGLLLVPETFDINANAAIQQGVIDPTAEVGNGNITGIANIQDVNTFSITPRLRKRFGQSVFSSLLYDHRFVKYESDESVDTEMRGLAFDVRTQSTARRLNWGFNARSDTAIFEDDRDDEVISLALINASLIVNNKFTLFGSLGYEKYELNTNLSEGDEPEGHTWSVGFTWLPTVRTIFNISHGEQFFGRSDSVSFRHQGKRSDLVIGARRAIDSKANLQFSTNTDPISPVNRTVGATTPEFDTKFISDRVYINLEYRFVNASFNADIYEDIRTYDLSIDDEIVLGGTATYTHRIARRTKLVLNAYYEDSTYVDGLSDIRSGASFKIDKAFSRRSSANIGYSYNERTGDASPYTSNLVRIQFVTQFNKKQSYIEE